MKNSIKLNEVLGIPDTPIEKIAIGTDMAEMVLKEIDKFDTETILYTHKSLLEMLAPIAVDRALDKTWRPYLKGNPWKLWRIIIPWERHPMFGINCPECTDKRAKSYQKVSLLADKIFAEILYRINGKS